MGWYNGLNITFLELLDFEQHFIQEISSDVTGKNREDEFLSVEGPKFFGNYFAKPDDLFALEISFMVLVDLLDLILVETVDDFG